MHSRECSQQNSHNLNKSLYSSNRPIPCTGMTSKEKEDSKKLNAFKHSLSSSDVSVNVKVGNEIQKSPFFHSLNPNLNNQNNFTFKPNTNSTTSSTRRTADTCLTVDPEFRREQQIPKNVLTKPSIPTFNNGYDNEDHDLILYANCVLGYKEGQRYLVLELLGKGTFGQVARCLNLQTRELVAVKVIKGKEAYYSQSLMEITILDLVSI